MAAQPAGAGAAGAFKARCLKLVDEVARDRLIVATARVAGAALVTRDRRILDYGARGHLRVIRA